jgi:MFS family permease
MAIVVGFFTSSLSWIVIAINPTIPTIVAGIIVFSIGEMTQAPRYYEYISELAPPGQQGLYQGYAFLPIAIAWFVGGPFGGWLYTTFAKETTNPNVIWFVLFGIGILAVVLMLIYNKVIKVQEDKITIK